MATPKQRVMSKASTASHLRFIADHLERCGMTRFPVPIRAAAREIAELRWEIGVLRKKVERLTKRIEK